MTNTGKSMREVFERMRARSETPEYQANVVALETDTKEQQILRAANDRKMFLAFSGIPRESWPWLDTPDATDAMAATRKFLEEPDCLFLTLAGPIGRGKTGAASWACYVKRGMFTTSHDLVRAGMFDGIWAEAEATPLLVIDELGAEHVNEASQTSMMGLLSKRQGNLRKTVIITNLDATGFGGRYTTGPMERLGERLKKYGIWVNLPGPSLRQHWSEKP